MTFLYWIAVLQWLSDAERLHVFATLLKWRLLLFRRMWGIYFYGLFCMGI